MLKTTFIVIYLLISSMMLYGEERSQQKGLQPSTENVFVLKHKKRKVRIPNKIAENIKSSDIQGINIIGDTIFLNVSDSIISKYDRNKKVKR